MSTFGQVSINVKNNEGVISIGDNNTIYNTLGLNSLPLPDDQHRRVLAALGAVAAGEAPSPDAAELKAAVVTAPDAATRTERVGKWLLKMAPAAAGVAGSLLTPAAGKAAELLAAWVARQLGGEA